ncbi:MAG: trypsin-like peptidase domain-containing protein [Candidatus Pacebacteria bacterium]|nr:trypsin-like peptidase domain-containing protein [Candidatus Paceibacterota bacterium]
MKEFLTTAVFKLVVTATAVIQFFLATPKQTVTPPSPIHLPQIAEVQQIPEVVLPDPFSVLSPENFQVENIPREKFFPLIPKKVTSRQNSVPQVATSKPQILDPRLHGWDLTNAKIAPAVVNIFCTLQTGNIIRTSTGSGVVIDPRGVILTNAHIAQYLLLADTTTNPKTNCTIRSGNPAKGNLSAKLLYISPAWMSEHGGDLLNPSPVGTGEYDYALLLETGNAHPFSPLADENENTDSGEDTILAGYPSPFTSLSSRDNLSFLSVLTQIEKTQGFRGNGNDLLYFGGSLLAERGSSGGPVINEDGKVLGILVTATPGITVASRESRAISASYIQKDFREENGTSIQEFLSGDLNTARANFMNQYGNSLGARLLQNFN